MNPYDTYTVDELLDLSTGTAPEALTRLAAVTTTATADGVTVHVNLEGRLVDLELSPDALATGPETLAATIFELTGEAAAAALDRGIELLAPEVGEELAAELRALVLPDTPAEAGRAPSDADVPPRAGGDHPAQSGVDSPASPQLGAEPPHSGTDSSPSSRAGSARPGTTAPEPGPGAARPARRAAPSTREQAPGDEDFSTVESWAVPH